MQSFGEWLNDNGLGRHAEVLVRNGVDFDVLRTLTEKDLGDLGLNLGDRRRLLQAIARLDQMAAPQGRPQVPINVAAPAGAGERRQLTVLFCDLVGSTGLAERMDPEELRTLMGRYQRVSGEAISRYDGHVAQYLGDGIMAYFGWPGAHEDDAERAARAALEIVQAVRQVEAPEPLAVRIGIATGPVVVGEGDGGVESRLAVGETPNLAARLQGLAGANEIVIAPSTRRLIAGACELTDLGSHTLKGIHEPVQTWRIEALSKAEGRFESARAAHLTPFVGRDEEIALLLRRWEQSKQGEGQVVLLSGEPGIGKSRVTQELRAAIQGEAHVRLQFQCSPYHANSAFQPVIEQFARGAGFTRDDSVSQKLDKLESFLRRAGDVSDVTLALFAAMLSLPLDRYPALTFSPQRQREETVRALAAQLSGLAARQPTLFLFEDAQWVDPSTLEALDLLVQGAPAVRVLMVITFRPEFQARWSGQSHVSVLLLNRLARRQAAALVSKVTGGRPLPDAVLDRIVAKTDGVPLFVEELTKAVLEGGLLREDSNRYELAQPLTDLAIPATLQDSLMARLDRLAPVKEVAQVGACIGRDFSYELLAAVLERGGEDLAQALDQLVGSELVFRTGRAPNATYTFKHALVHDAAYASLLKSRRHQLHSRIAQVLERDFAELIATQPELAAYHYTRAGLHQPAVAYWLKAGQRAFERFANVEALAHFQEGLSVLGELPEGTERDQTELSLQTGLGLALIWSKGPPDAETGAAFERARKLCERVGRTEDLIPILSGLWNFHVMRAEHGKANDRADEILTLSEQTGDPRTNIFGHWAKAGSMLFLGRPIDAVRHAAAGAARYDPQTHKGLGAAFGRNPGPLCTEFQSAGSWVLGYPDTAHTLARRAISLAEDCGHPLTLGVTLVHSALDVALWGEIDAAHTLAEDAIRVCTEAGIPLRRAEAEIIRGWVMANRGEPEAGAGLIQQGTAIWRQFGGEIGQPLWLYLLAQAWRIGGRLDGALAAMEEGLDFVARTEERQWEAELHRLSGELRLERDADDTSRAERCFYTALEVARSQQARMLELRAALSLARLWQRQTRKKEALDLLAPIYALFTEGFDTWELQEAKALLDSLR